jgi:putative copper export protein
MIEPWARALLLLAHLAGMVVWFGAIAYFLLVLRPAARDSGMERAQWYLLLRQVKRRLRPVVGAALLTLLATGLLQAKLRGMLRPELWATGYPGWIFVAKLAVFAALVGIFLTALPLIERIPVAKWRGRAFVWTHVAALVLGSVAAYLGLLLGG